MKLISFDTETTGLQTWQGCRPFAFSFAMGEEVFYYEFHVDPFTRKVIIDKRKMKDMRELLEDPLLTKVMHNSKFDIRMAASVGLTVTAPYHDTLIMSHAWNNVGGHGLKKLAKNELDFPEDDEKSLKEAVARCRNIAKKLNWKIGFKETPKPNGGVKRQGELPSDYWLPSALKRLHPELLPNKRWPNRCKRYAINDAIRTLLLCEFYLKALASEPACQETYRFEMELLPVVVAMEDRGVRVDPVRLRAKLRTSLNLANRFKKLVSKGAPENFNINSNVQIVDHLLAHGVNLTDKTAKGNYQVDAEALRKHKDHPMVYNLARYKAHNKAMTNFFCPFRSWMVPEGNEFIIHSSFNQIGCVTRRFSCSNPNLQNVTQKVQRMESRGVECRAPFGPRKGYVWYAFDYQQLESRIFADVANERDMQKVFEKELDLPSVVANRIWGGEGNPRMIHAAKEALRVRKLDTEQSPTILKVWKKFGFKDRMRQDKKSVKKFVTAWSDSFGWDLIKAEKSLDGSKATRHKMKAIIFAKQYGGGPRVIVRMLNWPWDEAVAIFQDFDDKYPDMADFLNETTLKCRREGFVMSAFGQRIEVPRDQPHKGVDYICQGSATNLLKRAMVKTYAYFKKHKIDGHLVMSIHDEIVFEILKAHATRQVLIALKRLMEDSEGVFTVKTPVSADIIVRRWDQPEGLDWLNKMKLIENKSNRR